MKTLLNRLYGDPLMKLNLQQFAEGEGAGEGGSGEGNPGADPAGAAGGSEQKQGEGTDPAKDLAAQLEQMKADMAKQKEALDKATSEAGKYRKELQKRQTQEEIDAANKKEAEEKRDQELEELRRKVARSENTRSVMSKLGLTEEVAGKIAESMIGCDNIDNALLLIRQAWDAKEKALKLEYGKIPGPGAGGSSEEDAEEKAAMEIAKRLGRNRAESEKSVVDGLKGYMR